jgi:hypothetical protein
MRPAAAALRRVGVAACAHTRHTLLQACAQEPRDRAALQSALLALSAAAAAGSAAQQTRCEPVPAPAAGDGGATNASAKWRVYTDVGRERFNQARAPCTVCRGAGRV